MSQCLFCKPKFTLQPLSDDECSEVFLTWRWRMIIFLMNRNWYFGFRNWIFAPFHPFSVPLHANSTWASSGASGVKPGRDIGEAERGGFDPLLKEWQRRTLALSLASWLSETLGTSGDRPPSGVCQWISLTPWWETQRLYNTSASLSASLRQWLTKTGNCHQPSLHSRSSTTLPVLTPHLSVYLSLVWR